MIFAPTTFRIFTAFFGLFAVVLGALEHEDLILQEAALHLSSKHAAETVSARDLVTSPLDDHILAEVKTDSGTEGTYRAESHDFWFPSENARPVWRLEQTTVLRVKLVRSELRDPARHGPLLVGITELRV